MFENRVLRRIFEHKGDEVTWERRKLHKEELNHMYTSPNIIQMIKLSRMRWAGMYVACMKERGGAFRVLVGKPGGK